MNGCKIPDCPEKHLAKGYCMKHHMRWRQHGDPNVVLERNSKKKG